jgi:hypothetical protein
MQRPSLQMRGVALLIVTSLFAMQPVVEGLHHLIQPHFYCLEHSSFEHLIGHGEGGKTAGRDTVVTNASPFDPTNDDHVLCPISQQAQSHGRVVTPAATQAEMCCELAAIPAVELLLSSVPLLSYAPKHSPPSSDVALSI